MKAADCHKLEEVARRFYPSEFAQCKEYMRHKTILINPYLLREIDPSIEIHK